MQIVLENLGKRFNREWIFRRFDHELQSGNSYTFVGPNGSGKSTLMQVIAGAVPHTEGTISYLLDNKTLEIDQWYRHIVIAAPYLELIEEFTVSELLDFHTGFKPLKKGITETFLLQQIELDNARHKPIKNFSSGMKQRLKLALAFYSDVPVVMLDEPTSNLDARWSAWYKQEVQRLTQGQLLIICSNLPFEYDFCSHVIDLNRFKEAIS
ncbi:MAG: ATP-binding cassette domain-containing protein [Runella sp.]